MTDSPPTPEPGPIDPDVELASAHLDGEAGAEERARVDDADVQGSLAALRQVSEQVRDVPPAPPGLVDDHVARALEAFGDEDRVVALDRRRPGAKPWWQRIPLGAVAAGLVVVALIGAIALASTGDDDDADSATADLERADDLIGPGAGGGGGTTSDAGPAAGAMEDSTALESGGGFDAVGQRIYDTYDALADDLRAELSSATRGAEADARDAEGDSGSTAAGEAAPSGDPCDAVGLLDLDPAAVVLVRSVTVPPDEVTAVVHDAADGRRLTVVEDGTCTVVLDRLL